VHYDKGDLDQAKDYYQRALDIRKKQLGPNHVHFADSYNNSIVVCWKKGKVDHAG
jgi:Tfp pilus assembly protein PilF